MSNSVEQESKRYLIAIGSPSAGDLNLHRLDNIEEDIRRVNRIFTSPQQEYQRILQDQIALAATTPEIKSALTNWFSLSEHKSSDCVIIYYAGHGGECGTSGSHYLYTNGSRPDNLQNTAIETGSLVKWFLEGHQNCPQNILLILDVCYAGQGIAESIVNLAKSNTPKSGEVWIWGSSNSHTEASDGGFIDALEHVLENCQFQHEELFVDLSTLNREVNSYFESKKSCQRAVISTLNSSNTPIFIRNPIASFVQLGGTKERTPNITSINQFKTEKELFINRQSTEKFIKDALKVIEESQSQPSMLYAYGIGGIGKSTLLQQLKQLYSDKAVFLYFSFPDPITSNAINTPIQLLKDLYEQLDIKNKSSDPFWMLHEQYVKTLYYLKTDLIEMPVKNNMAQLSLIQEYEHYCEKSDDSIAPLDKVTIPNEFVFPSNISVRDRFEQLLNQHSATKNNLDLITLLLDPLPKFFIAFSDGLEKNRGQYPIILLLDTYEKAPSKFDKFISQYLMNNKFKFSSISIFMAGRFSLTSPHYRRIFQRDNKLFREYRLDKFNYPETQSYLSQIGVTRPDMINKIWKATKGYPYYLNLIKSQLDNGSYIDLSLNTRDMLDLLLASLSDSEKSVVQLAAYCRWFDRPLINHLTSSCSHFFHFPNHSNVDWFEWLVERDFVIEGNKYYQLDDVARDIIRRYQWRINENDFRLIHKAIAAYFDKQAEEAGGSEQLITEKYENSDWRRFIAESTYHKLFANRDQGKKQFITYFLEGAYLKKPEITMSVLGTITEEAAFENSLLPKDTVNLLMGNDNMSFAIMFGWQVISHHPYQFEINFTEIMDQDGKPLKIDITNKVESSLNMLFKEADKLNGLAKYVALIERGIRNVPQRGIVDFKRALEEASIIRKCEDSKLSNNIFIQLGCIWGNTGYILNDNEYHQKALDCFSNAIEIDYDTADTHRLKGIS
jgi:Caspase domain